jgi:ribonuclease-3
MPSIDQAELEKILGTKINNPDIYLSAFTHRSYLNENRSFRLPHNERLEFLGDAVLDFVAGAVLYHRYPEMNEGGLTRLRAALVNTEQLAVFSSQLALGDHLRLGKGEADSGGRQRVTLLCAAFEAAVGAYYLDSGLEAVRAFVEPLFSAAASQILANDMDVDPKSHFQEWAQAAHGQTPRYTQVGLTGPDHSRVYTVEVLVGDERFGTGSGPNKQAAAQAAARAALSKVAGL